MQLPVGVLEDVVAPHVHGHVLLPQSFIQPLQLLAEIPTTGWIRGGGGGEEKKAKKIKEMIFFGGERGAVTLLQGRRRPPPPTPLLALDVEVEDADVVDEDGEGAVGQMGGGLP